MQDLLSPAERSVVDGAPDFSPMCDIEDIIVVCLRAFMASQARWRPTIIGPVAAADWPKTVRELMGRA
eukprot:4041551-Pyramimonas_sp.AAC.1